MMIRLLILVGGFALLLLSLPTDSFAASDCGKLVRGASGDIIVNTCAVCQNIHIVRSRGGGALPDVRTLRIEGRSQLALPFKGPGSTRITGNDACQPELGAERRNERKVAEASAMCVLTANLANGYVLLNRCPACRQTIVRWQYADGVERNLPVTIDARSTLNVPRGAEIGLSVIHEEPCKG